MGVSVPPTVLGARVDRGLDSRLRGNDWLGGRTRRSGATSIPQAMDTACLYRGLDSRLRGNDWLGGEQGGVEQPRFPKRWIQRAYTGVWIPARAGMTGWERRGFKTRLPCLLTQGNRVLNAGGFVIRHPRNPSSPRRRESRPPSTLAPRTEGATLTPALMTLAPCLLLQDVCSIYIRICVRIKNGILSLWETSP